MAEKPMGIYEHRERCRLCESEELTKFLDFGKVPLAGGFLRQDQLDDERFYPLARETSSFGITSTSLLASRLW